VSSRVQGIRFDEEELSAFKAAAAKAGLPFSTWAVRAMKGTAQLEAALAAQEERRARPVHC
jgi:predicted DNA binding CopG/RHH family protein